LVCALVATLSPGIVIHDLSDPAGPAYLIGWKDRPWTGWKSLPSWQ
jgi:hypothetical protein